jgi:hypothetical protein
MTDFEPNYINISFINNNMAVVLILSVETEPLT